jgi:hypothetical protein
MQVSVENIYPVITYFDKIYKLIKCEKNSELSSVQLTSMWM